MKISRLYLFFLFAFLAVVFLVELMAPHQFVWNPTYDKHDKEPFGSYVFDDVLSSSIDNYAVVNKTFYQLYQEDSTVSSNAFLLTEDFIDLNATDIDYLYKLLHLGNQVMICSDDYSRFLKDTLRFEISYDRYVSIKVASILNNPIRDSLFFGADTLQPERIFEVFPYVHPISLKFQHKKDEQADEENRKGADSDEEDSSDEDDSSSKKTAPINCDSLEVLVWDKNNKPLVIRTFIGKGELFIVTTPLMFTNFGMLDGNNASYIFTLLSYMKNRPLLRIEAYGMHLDKPQTPLRYILSEAPLRWATYSIMILLLLFMFFTAKRRQRIIPVVNTPPNRTLGFMQLISNLYYQKHNNVEILKMKYLYFCTEVKSLIGVELTENVPNDPDYERLIEKTGMEKDFICLLLQNIRIAVYSEEITDTQLQQTIDGMNKLLIALKT